jgi:hypothetical protein
MVQWVAAAAAFAALRPRFPAMPFLPRKLNQSLPNKQTIQQVSEAVTVLVTSLLFFYTVTITDASPPVAPDIRPESSVVPGAVIPALCYVIYLSFHILSVRVFCR